MSAPTKPRDAPEAPAPTYRSDGAPRAALEDAPPFDASPVAPTRPPLELLRPRSERGLRRAVAFGLVAWLPLALLTAAEGNFLGADPRSAFLRDVATHCRYLLALPLLALAESICLPRLSFIARHFDNAALVPDEQKDRYEALLASARAQLRSRTAATVLVGFAYVLSIALGWILYPEGGNSWVATWTNGVRAPTLAGLWRAMVSQPLVLLLGATWIWRLIVWTRLLAGLSRLDLRLVPAHPDGAAGLRFVAASLRPMSLLGAAFASWAAGGAADRVLYGGWSLEVFGRVVGVVVAIIVVLCAGPLFALVQPLRRARLRGLFMYGPLASAVGRQFEEQWLRDPRGIDADSLSASDFSATTDLYSIVANVDAMKFAPLGLRDLVPLVVASAAPFLPVALLAAPLEEVLHLLGKLVL